jgi:folylpolyglutamate synthase/dihydropteroate synthase
LAKAAGNNAARAVPDPLAAVQHALAVTDESGIVCVTGSLYLVGEVRATLVTRPAS